MHHIIKLTEQIKQYATVKFANATKRDELLFELNAQIKELISLSPHQDNKDITKDINQIMSELIVNSAIDPAIHGVIEHTLLYLAINTQGTAILPIATNMRNVVDELLKNSKLKKQRPQIATINDTINTNLNSAASCLYQPPNDQDILKIILARKILNTLTTWATTTEEKEHHGKLLFTIANNLSETQPHHALDTLLCHPTLPERDDVKSLLNNIITAYEKNHHTPELIEKYAEIIKKPKLPNWIKELFINRTKDAANSIENISHNQLIDNCDSLIDIYTVAPDAHKPVFFDLSLKFIKLLSGKTDGNDTLLSLKLINAVLNNDAFNQNDLNKSLKLFYQSNAIAIEHTQQINDLIDNICTIAKDITPSIITPILEHWKKNMLIAATDKSFEYFPKDDDFLETCLNLKLKIHDDFLAAADKKINPLIVSKHTVHSMNCKDLSQHPLYPQFMARYIDDVVNDAAGDELGALFDIIIADRHYTDEKETAISKWFKVLETVKEEDENLYNVTCIRSLNALKGNDYASEFYNRLKKHYEQSGGIYETTMTPAQFLNALKLG